MTDYFIHHNWVRHSENVWEAKGFANEDNRAELIDFFNQQDSSCNLHNHNHHTVNNQDKSDVLFWDAECIPKNKALERVYDSLSGISRLLHEMNDAANRRTGYPMQLTKVVFHKYVKNSSGPEHADVYPLATLLYLNDDYKGGQLYFPKQGFSISPAAGSLLAFDGGTDHKHAVKEITEGNRYVFVAFWDYEDSTKMKEFWQSENEHTAAISKNLEDDRKRLESMHPRAKVLFHSSFPIVEINNFIEKPLADSLVNLLKANHMPNDECFAPPCFPEYYEKIYGKKPEPVQVDGADENTLKEINAQLKTLVAAFLNRYEHSLAFSKFKGHNHITGAYSPPHQHEPAVGVAILSLNEDFEGGEITIPSLDIEFAVKPYSLYIFREHEMAKHGVKMVTGGERICLVSHWQDLDHPYDKAGANI